MELCRSPAFLKLSVYLHSYRSPPRLLLPPADCIYMRAVHLLLPLCGRRGWRDITIIEKKDVIGAEDSQRSYVSSMLLLLLLLVQKCTLVACAAVQGALRTRP